MLNSICIFQPLQNIYIYICMWSILDTVIHHHDSIELVARRHDVNV